MEQESLRVQEFFLRGRLFRIEVDDELSLTARLQICRRRTHLQRVHWARRRRVEQPAGAPGIAVARARDQESATEERHGQAGESKHAGSG